MQESTIDTIKKYLPFLDQDDGLIEIETSNDSNDSNDKDEEKAHDSSDEYSHASKCIWKMDREA